MEYKSEKQKGSVKFTFSVPHEEWEAEMNASYLKNKGRYNVTGFRRGHAPRKVIENLYGPTVFFDDAFNACASKAYGKALDENADVYPVDEPRADITSLDEKGIGFTLEVTVKPEVTLGQYKGLTVEKAEYPVADKDVDAEIERSRQAKSRLVDITDRAAQDGDTVNIDYSGTVNGVKFDGGTAEKQSLTLGSHSFIPGFEEQVVGMQIGESKDLSVKFPDDYHAEELKGKDAVFAVTLHAIQKREVPELNDAFVKDTTKFETVQEYRADVEKRLRDNAKRREDNENKNKIIEAVTENATADIPDCMVESELDYMLRDFEYRLSYMYGGMKLDDYFKYTGSSREAFRKDRREEAKKAVKTRLTVEAIIKAEKIEATEDDMNARIQELAEQTGKSAEEYRKTLSDRQLSQIKSDATVEKTLTVLSDATVFVPKAKETEKSTAKADTVKKTATKTAATKTAAAKKTTTKEEK